MQAKTAPASRVFLRTLTHWVLQKQWLNYNKLKCCQQNALPTCPKCTVIGRLCSQVCTSFLCVDTEWVEVESSLLLDWLFSVISCKWSYQAEVFMARAHACVCVSSQNMWVYLLLKTTLHFFDAHLCVVLCLQKTHSSKTEKYETKPDIIKTN